MPRPESTPAKLSKTPTDKKIGRSRSIDRWFDPVIDELSGIFPRKLALELAVRSGRPQRVCELWLQGKAAPNGEALAALICSDVGDRVLMAVTRRCAHPWAENARAVHEISQLRKQQAEAARRLEALERGIR